MTQKSKISLDNIPLDSSLGLLAVGDVAFVKWREIKQKENVKAGKEQKKKQINE